MAKKHNDNGGVNRERVEFLVNSVFEAGKIYHQALIDAGDRINKACECEKAKDNAIENLLKELNGG